MRPDGVASRCGSCTMKVVALCVKAEHRNQHRTRPRCLTGPFCLKLLQPSLVIKHSQTPSDEHWTLGTDATAAPNTFNWAHSKSLSRCLMIVLSGAAYVEYKSRSCDEVDDTSENPSTQHNLCCNDKVVGPKCLFARCRTLAVIHHTLLKSHRAKTSHMALTRDTRPCTTIQVSVENSGAKVHTFA